MSTANKINEATKALSNVLELIDVLDKAEFENTMVENLILSKDEIKKLINTFSDAVYELEAVQTLSTGTKCLFSFKELKSDMVKEFNEVLGYYHDFENLESKNCVIENLETFTELGNKDFEYYNIKFEHLPKIVFVGISGYHLTPIE